MRARLPRGRDSLEAVAVETDAVKIPLSGVLGRGREVDPVGAGVDGEQLNHIEVAGGDQLQVLPVAADTIKVPPAVAFAEPEEFFAVVNPVDLFLKIDPGRVVVLEDRLDLRGGECLAETDGCLGRSVGFSTTRFSQHDGDGVLMPVELLKDELVGCFRPTPCRRCNCREGRPAR